MHLLSKLHNLLDLEMLFRTYGYVGALIVFFVIFAESGLLIGFFLPGDSVLFTAGFLASRGYIDIWFLAIGCFIAAVTGDSIGYSFGKRVGQKLFHRENSVLFHKDNLLKAQQFYAIHGKKTIILARFLPVVRTFAPIVAGIADMHYPTFLAFNIVGGLLWAVGLSVAGYFLGRVIPNVDRYLLPIIVGIILVSILPTLIHIFKEEKHRKQLKDFLLKPFKK